MNSQEVKKMTEQQFLDRLRADWPQQEYSGKTAVLSKCDMEPSIKPLVSPTALDMATRGIVVGESTAADYIQQGLGLSVIFPVRATPSGMTTPITVSPESVRTVPRADRSLLEEEGYFVEAADGVYADRGENEGFLITNIRVRVQARVKKYWDDESEPEEELRCELYAEQWSQPRIIHVPMTEYKDIYNLHIKKSIPELYLSTKGRDALEMYLSRVFQECQPRLTEEVQIMLPGWSAVTGRTCYEMGEGMMKLPDYSTLDYARTFIEGFNFLKIGKFESAAVIPFIFAHFSYTLFFARKAHHDFSSVLFICGESNSGKTSLAELFCNIFRETKDKLSFGTTKAALFGTLARLRDQTILLDDFSCSEKKKKQADTELFEAAVRAIGDSTAPSKMAAAKGRSAVDHRHYRATLVVTGEDTPELSSSSYYRMIMVPVKQGYYDETELTSFQDDPTIMRNYMALFVEFLRTNEEGVVDFIRDQLPKYRQKYGHYFAIPRVRDAAINLMLMADIVRDYSKWCGVTDHDALNQIDCFRATILEAMRANEEESRELDPALMFVYALKQLMGTREKTGLASSEKQYSQAESSYLGFEEEKTGTIWLRYEDAEKQVKSYWDGQGKEFVISSSKLHRLLFERNISVGRQADSGRKEYLVKKKTPPRKRMLVLKKQKVNELLDSIKK